jgi:hypothetical protein
MRAQFIGVSVWYASARAYTAETQKFRTRPQSGIHPNVPQYFFQLLWTGKMCMLYDTLVQTYKEVFIRGNREKIIEKWNIVWSREAYMNAQLDDF